MVAATSLAVAAPPGRNQVTVQLSAPSIARVTTIEGLAADGRLHPLQEACADLGGAQCGYCTPGILVTAKALLDRDPAPSRERIREALSGNLCRCTGYLQIFEAVEAAVAAGTKR